MQDHNNNKSAMHSLEADLLAMLSRQHEQLQKNIADIFATHAKHPEQPVSASVDKPSPRSPPLRSRSSSLRSVGKDGQHNQGVLLQTPQIQESEFDMPHQVATHIQETDLGTPHQVTGSASQTRPSMLSESAWAEAQPMSAEKARQDGEEEPGMYVASSTPKSRSTSTLQRKRTGVSLNDTPDVRSVDALPVPMPIHDVFPRIVRSNHFEVFSVCTVISNALSIALQADWSVNHLGEDLPLIFDVLEIMFSVIFLLELLIRIGASGRFFLSCSNRELNWNIFDSILVSSSVLELPLIFLLGSLSISLLHAF